MTINGSGGSFQEVAQAALVGAVAGAVWMLVQ